MNPCLAHSSSSPASASKLRVLIVTESFLPQINGVTASVCRVLEHLQATGHTAAVIAPTGPDRYAGADVHTVAAAPVPGYPSFRVGLATHRSITRVMRDFQPDVVHLASPFMLGAVAAKAANRAGIPTVAIYQTDLVGFARRYHLSLAARGIERHLHRLHASVDRTLAPSTASMDQLGHLGVPRLHRWERGVDLERFTPRRRHPSAEGSGTQSGKTVVGYVGRLAREKNLEHLIAVQELPQTELVVIGDGPLREELQQRLPLAQFLGEKSGDELADLIASLDIFVHPGAEETFCQAAQEALASGVPVIGPASGGLMDRVQHNHDGLLYTPGDRHALQQAVAELSADPLRRQQMSRQARDSVQGRSWSLVNDQLIGHYRAITTTPRAQTPSRGSSTASRELVACSL